MCRTGGRRCPSHSDPKKVAAYNERRRLLYNLKVKLNNPAAFEDFSSRFDTFPIDALRKHMTEEQHAVFHSDAVKFAKTLMPDYEKKTSERTRWTVDHDYYTRALDKNEALLFYTGANYDTIRNYLNSGLPENPDRVDPNDRYTTFGQHKEWFSENIEIMDKTLALAEPPEGPRLVYRGMRLNRRAVTPEQLDTWMEENFPVGGIVSQKNYMSTSLTPEISLGQFSNHGEGSIGPDEASKRSVFIEIMTKKGAVLGTGTATMLETEAEVLIPRNAKFKIVSVDKDVRVPFEKKSKDNQVTIDYARRTVIRMVDVGDEE